MTYVPSFQIDNIVILESDYVLQTLIVEDAGGQPIQITGSFSAGNTMGPVDTEVFVVVSGQDIPCYSNESGRGYLSFPFEKRILVAAAPPLPIGGPYDVKIVQGGDTIIVENQLTVVARNWESKAFAFRRLLPPWYATGKRNLANFPSLI